MHIFIPTFIMRLFQILHNKKRTPTHPFFVVQKSKRNPPIVLTDTQSQITPDRPLCKLPDLLPKAIPFYTIETPLKPLLIKYFWKRTVFSKICNVVSMNKIIAYLLRIVNPFFNIILMYCCIKYAFLY